jgi:hypothetical protein
VHGRFGHSFKLGLGLLRNANTRCAAGLNKGFEPSIVAFAGDGDVVKVARTRAERLLYRVDAVEHFHSFQCTAGWI